MGRGEIAAFYQYFDGKVGAYEVNISVEKNGGMYSGIGNLTSVVDMVSAGEATITVQNNGSNEIMSVDGIAVLLKGKSVIGIAFPFFGNLEGGKKGSFIINSNTLSIMAGLDTDFDNVYFYFNHGITW